VEAIINMQPQMERIKQEVQNQDRHMQKQSKSLRKALLKTVNTDGLKTKIVAKFMGFLTVNINKKDKEE